VISFEEVLGSKRSVYIPEASLNPLVYPDLYPNMYPETIMTIVSTMAIDCK
jgi:hypothetical protein